MAYTLDDDDSYGSEESWSSGKKDNLFGWTVLILLLIGVAFACWLGTYQIFGHPENPRSYAILKKLGKIDPPKRFELTKAPAGKFLTPKELYDRYASMTSLELRRENDELMRDYLRNYTETKKPLTYVVGKYEVLNSFELKEGDLMPSGVVALAQPADYPNVLIEHLFPASGGNISGLRANLVTGADLPLKRSLDLSVVIHVEKIYDGRLLFTVVPLLYGSYAVRQGGGVSLEPPGDVNLAGGVPVLKPDTLQESFRTYAEYQRGSTSGEGAIADTGEAAQPSLVRVEKPLQPDGIAEATPEPEETPIPVVRAVPVATPAAAEGSPSPTELAMNQTPAPLPTPAAFVSPQPGTSPGVALQPFIRAQTPSAGTRGAGTWRVYSAGQLPPGKLVDVPTVATASGPIQGETLYLQGDFIVTAAGENRAVLRSRSATMAARVIVSFPSGSSPPPEGSTVTRAGSRPFQIMEVRKGADGQTNIYVREITAP